MAIVHKLSPLLVAAAASLVFAASGAAAPDSPVPSARVVVGYADAAALRAALARHPATIVRRLPALRAVEVVPRGDAAAFARAVRGHRGIAFVDRPARRESRTEPALAPAPTGRVAQWQYAATRLDAVPAEVARSASSVTIAVIDTGADLTAPDLAAKTPATFNVTTRTADVRDLNGHGTFVASLAAGSATNGEGIAGAAGEASLMVIQAGRQSGAFTDVEEAAAIVYAVDHGADIVNLSFGGPATSRVEQRAVDYAVAKGALLVAAVGNEFSKGNPVEYPAALLQPVGSNGAGGRGLAVGASTAQGTRASFSNTGSHLSLVAPGERVLGALSSFSSAAAYPRFVLPGSTAGLYGYASGTSFAVPQVAGIAALVWAANPTLTASGVADVLEQTASGRGRWTPEVGYGVVDAAAAIARATGAAAPAAPAPTARDPRLTGFRDGRRVHLSWQDDGAAAYRLSVKTSRNSERVLIGQTTQTSASYRVSPGYTYTFRVTSLDATGTSKATSPPFVIRVRR